MTGPRGPSCVAFSGADGPLFVFLATVGPQIPETTATGTAPCQTTRTQPVTWERHRRMEDPMPFRFLLVLLPFLLSAFESGAGDNSDAEDGDGDGHNDESKGKDKIEWTPEQQAAISKIAAREARKAADKARKDRDAEIEAEQSQREQDAQRKKDQEAGEFDKVRQSLESERDTVTGERDSLKSRVEVLEKLAAERLQALLEDIPKEIADLAPPESTPIEERLAWAEKAAKAAGTKTSPRGNGFDPRPGSTGTTTEEDKRARASMRPRL